MTRLFTMHRNGAMAAMVRLEFHSLVCFRSVNLSSLNEILKPKNKITLHLRFLIMTYVDKIASIVETEK